MDSWVRLEEGLYCTIRIVRTEGIICRIINPYRSTLIDFGRQSEPLGLRKEVSSLSYIITGVCCFEVRPMSGEMILKR